MKALQIYSFPMYLGTRTAFAEGQLGEWEMSALLCKLFPLGVLELKWITTEQPTWFGGNSLVVWSDAVLIEAYK